MYHRISLEFSIFIFHLKEGKRSKVDNLLDSFEYVGCPASKSVIIKGYV